MNLLAQTTLPTSIDAPLPAWATVALSFVAGLVAVLTVVKLFLLPLVRSLVAEARQIAIEARATSIRNVDRIADAKATAAEAKGIAQSASGTADKALAQTTPGEDKPRQ